MSGQRGDVSAPRILNPMANALPSGRAGAFKILIATTFSTVHSIRDGTHWCGQPRAEEPMARSMACQVP